jgi:hypothetical protein
MSTLRRLINRISEIFQYWRFLRQRRAQLKRAKKDDPNVYPLY